MRVLVTGGTGFIGRRVIAALLERGALAGPDGAEQPIDALLVSDLAEPLQPLPDDARIQAVYGDFTEQTVLEALLSEETGVVFHLAGVVSAEAEQDFDLGMRVNLLGTQRLLEACRRLQTCPRFVFPSSSVNYGGDLPEVIEDDTALNPQTSYGSQKTMLEFLINDYSRKGFVDGRTLRLPAVVVRPGKPNKSAASFASSIIREPLAGREVECPVSEEAGMWVLSPRRAVACLLRAAELGAEVWGTNRAMLLPGTTVSVREMLDVLREVAGDAVASRVRFAPDPFIEKIVYSWPLRYAPRRAESMGFRGDGSFREIVDAYIEDELGGRIVA